MGGQVFCERAGLWGIFARNMGMDLEGTGFRVGTIFSLLEYTLAHYNLYSIMLEQQLPERQDDGLKLVTAALIIQDGRGLIAQRATPPSLAGFWEFPGGLLEDGESLEECLIREIREELEVNISISRWYGESIYDYDSGSINLQAFVCVLERGSLKPNVHSKLVWSSLEELSQWQFLPADIPFVERLVAEGLLV